MRELSQSDDCPGVRGVCPAEHKKMSAKSKNQELPRSNKKPWTAKSYTREAHLLITEAGTIPAGPGRAMALSNLSARVCLLDAQFNELQKANNIGGTQSERAEYYAAIAEAKRQTTPELTAEEKAKEAGRKALMDEKAATLALELGQAAEIRKLGGEIIEGIVATGKLYLNLCLYIRKNMVSPKLVTKELLELGFRKDVASRVNKVAQSSEDSFSQFAAGTIGFNKTLELARGEVPGSMAKAMGQSVIDIKAQVEELEAEDAETESASGKPLIAPTADETKAKFETIITKAAARVLSACASLESHRQRKINGGNGYLMVITWDKNFKPATPAPEAEGAE